MFVMDVPTPFYRIGQKIIQINITMFTIQFFAYKVKRIFFASGSLPPWLYCNAPASCV